MSPSKRFAVAELSTDTLSKLPRLRSVQKLVTFPSAEPYAPVPLLPEVFSAEVIGAVPVPSEPYLNGLSPAPQSIVILFRLRV